MYIYILELENNKYYIGKSQSNPEQRIKQHINGNGSYWTKKHKFLNIIETIPNCSKYDEDKYTLLYMEKYGIFNVRGGSFCKPFLDKEDVRTIHRLIQSNNDLCYRCGRSGHFIRDCYAKHHAKGYKLEESDSDSSFEIIAYDSKSDEEYYEEYYEKDDGCIIT